MTGNPTGWVSVGPRPEPRRDDEGPETSAAGSS